MCVIILQPKEAHLDKERAERLWKVNPDGGGFSFVNDRRKIETWKAMDFNPFWKRFEEARSDNPQTDFLIHFRIATHGTVDLDNVHPIVIDEDNVVAHNGVIHRAPSDPLKKKSDTVMFVEDILPQMPDQWLDSKLFFEMVEEWIDWSKLVFLTTDQELAYRYYILNENKGSWTEGMWFSSYNGVNKPTKWQQESDKKHKERLLAANQAVQQYRADKDKFPSNQKLEHLTSEERKAAYKEWLASDNGKPMTYSEVSGGVSEATARAEWDEWRDELGMDLEEYAKIAIPLGTGAGDLREFLGKDEADVFLELLEQDREAQGLDKQIQWSLDTGDVDCYGCDEEVDLETGQCGCWDKFCMDCEKIAGLCDCKEGYSSNLRLWSELGPKGEK